MSYYKYVVDNYKDVLEALKTNDVNPEEFTSECYTCIESVGRCILSDVFSGNMRTVHHLVSVRTRYSNEAVLFPVNTGIGSSFLYTTLKEYKFEEHNRPLYDSALLAAKKTFEQFFYTKSITEAIRNTAFYPVGAAVIDEQVYVLSHIIVDEDLFTSGLLVLDDSASLVPLSSLTAKDKVSSSALKKLQIYTKR